MARTQGVFIRDLHLAPASVSPGPHLANAMVVDFNKLWKNARTTVDEAESVRTLAKILSSTDGRTFISNLEPLEAELCIDILDRVSSNPPSATAMATHQGND